jgi:predicted secreted protein
MVPSLAILLICTVDDITYKPGTRPALTVGDTLTVKLDALPGAGYIWQPTTDGRPNLKYISVKTLPERAGNVGGKRTMVLRFLATASGDAKLTLIYGRPWMINKGEKPEKTLEVPVSVAK